jgi:sulfur transfer complex TusBCD TusB component (DsrH family)
MKEHLYTLLDEYYFDVLRTVIEAFERFGYTPIIVGGVAVQMHIIALVGVESSRFLRKTNDYDLVVLGAEKKRIEEIISKLNGEYFKTSNAVFFISVARPGAKRPILRVEYLNGENEIKNAEIRLNIFTESNDLEHISPERAMLMYNDAVEIAIKHSRTLSELKARVLRIEDLIAAKITKGRDKDYKDVDNLVNIVKEKGVEIDWRRIKENLRSIKDVSVRKKAINAMRSFEGKPALVGG